MKSKHEIIAIAVMLVICLLFAACSQKVGEKLTDKATDPALISSTTEIADGSDADSESVKTDSEGVSQNDADEAGSETSKAQSATDTDTQITADYALEELQAFYGTLYSVKENGHKKSNYYYIVNDNNQKEYAKVTVDLNTGVATEVISASGETNEINLLV